MNLGGKMGHYDGEVRKFRKELAEHGFIWKETGNKGTVKIYREGEPFYNYHVGAKGINHVKEWIKHNYKVDMFNRPKKNLTKREMRANLNSRLQEAEQQRALTQRRFGEVMIFLMQKHPLVFEEWNSRFEEDNI